jgi:hypothetical protein
MKPLYLFALLLCIEISHAQNTCRCESDDDKKKYIIKINELIKGTNTCIDCGLNRHETVLIYDAKCKNFLIKESGLTNLKILRDLSDLKLRYKKPFRIKLVNFNRYIYNLNFASSDVAFGSQMSAVMQQYLFPGAGTAQVTPANTYTNGVSENGGGYIYSYISGFKANMDFLLNKTEGISLPLTAQKDITKLEHFLETIFSNNSISQSEKDLFNNQIALFDSVSNYIVPDSLDFTKNIKEATQKRAIIMNIYHITDTIFTNRRRILQEQVTRKEVPKMLASTTKSLSADSLKLTKILDSITRSISADSLLLSKAGNVITRGRILLEDIKNLGRYCDSFIDDRIKAYSLCTPEFECCKSPLAIYGHFETLLDYVSISIHLMKKAKLVYDSAYAAVQRTKAHPAEPGVQPKKMTDNKSSAKAPAAKKDSSAKGASAKGIAMASQGKVSASKPDSVKPMVLAVSTSDLVFTNGRLTGITIHQVPDTSKPKKPDAVSDAFASVDSLWNAFEKSIPTDYIMRQIIFRNSMINSNMAYTSPPIYPYGDRLGLVMQISPSDSIIKMGTAPISSEAVSLDFEVRGRPLFSFSAGSFAGVWLRSPTYTWQQVPAPGSNMVQPTSPYQLVRTGGGNTPIGFNGMANITWPTWDKNLRLGVSGGVGAVVDPTPIRVGYLLGGTVSLGTYQQFHFTFGLSGMNVNQLKDNLSSSITYASAPTIDLYNQKIKVGGFFCVTYTIFSPKSTGAGLNATTSSPAAAPTTTSTPPAGTTKQ